MGKTISLVLRALVAAAVLAMGACGGGGGDEETGLAITPAPVAEEAPGDVSVVLAPPEAISAHIEVRSALPFLALRGKVMGNLARLTGKTIYVVLDDPDALFQPEAVVATLTPEGDVHADVPGRPVAAVASLSGALTVHACLDAACTVKLNGPPVRIPYQVKVLPAVDIGTAAIGMEALFGDPEVVRTVPLAAQGKITSLGWVYLAPRDGPQPFSVDVSFADGSAQGVILTFHPMAPGSYGQTFTLTGTVELDGLSYRFSRNIAIRYITHDNPQVDHVFSVPGVVLHVTPGMAQRADYWALARPGTTVTRHGVESLSHPPEAAGDPGLQSWWNDETRSAAPCPGMPADLDKCLPPGTYTARVHYVFSRDGVDSDAYFPVTMHVLR